MKISDERFLPLQQCLEKNLNASKPSKYPPSKGGEMSKRLDGNIMVDCKDRNSS